MANSRICSIEGCDKAAKARGWCGGHWWRWKVHGNPLGGRAHNRGDVNQYLENVVLKYEGDECLAWPFSRNRGRGQIRRDGKLQTVSRIVCENANGPAPSPDYEAAHSCGKGHEGCVTKRHLSWKTHASNMDDKFDHGTVTRGEAVKGAKLKEADIVAIRSMSTSVSQREIAARYSITQSQVSRIVTGAGWAHVGGD